MSGKNKQNGVSSFFDNAFSFAIVIVILIVMLPLGLFFLYKYLTKDKTNVMKNAKVLRGFGIGFVFFGLFGSSLAWEKLPETGERLFSLSSFTLGLLITVIGLIMIIDAAIKSRQAYVAAPDETLSHERERMFKKARISRNFGIGAMALGLFALSMTLENGDFTPSGFSFDAIFIALGLFLFFRAAQKNRLARSFGADMTVDGAAQKKTAAAPSTPLQVCKASVEEYLRGNKSTDFFREKLSAVAERLDLLDLRCGKIKDVIAGRFGREGLSYGKFTAPVEDLQEYIVKKTGSLVSRMHAFGEEEYGRRIGEFEKEHRVQEAEAYREVEQEYKAYAENTLSALDHAILMLDKLTLEISKLEEADADKALDIMADLEKTIRDTALYQ